MAVYSIAIHGGAGTVLREEMDPELEKEYLFSLEQALEAGYSILANGGTAIDAVKSSCLQLENNILFNAGRGSVFTHSGDHEMDAAIMDGSNLKAGSVSGVQHVRNPILLAAEIMEAGHHVFLSGKGALQFALEKNIKLEPEDYFFSQFRYKQWVDSRDSDSYMLDHVNLKKESLMKDKKFGTIGAVARDMEGNLAAGTSTGGMTNKKYGRIGDTPVIGSGTYANNRTCAISCTGHGEMFILAVAAYDVSCLMEYKGLSLEEALKTVVKEKLVKMKGEGGIIGVDSQGNTSMIFNTAGMYRASRSSSGHFEIGIYQ